MKRMHDHEVEVSETLVRQLLAAQMPALNDRSLTIVQPWGTDNAIWRLGDDLVVRLPRISWAVEQVEFESEWLPRLAPHLPVTVPEPVAVGEPGHGYPFPWAVHRWLPGENADPGQLADFGLQGEPDRLAGSDSSAGLNRLAERCPLRDPVAFALDLAECVRSLQKVSTSGARGALNRARPLREYDKATRRAIRSASHLIDSSAAERIWDEAVFAEAHLGEPVWVHGDLEGNCLVQEDRLCGLIDWGLACAGDPAVDIQVVWSPLFTDTSREVFFDALDVDEAMIARSRGAAINSACAALPYYFDSFPLIVERSWRKLAVLGVHPLSST